jgi:hypothetical protein
LSWTIIFGLAFAFFMTLFMVPSMYLIAERLRRPMRNMYGGKWISFLGIPPFTPVFLYLVFVNLQLKPVQKFFRIRRDILFGLALAPVVLLILWLLSIWFPSPLLGGIMGLLLVVSLIFPVLVIIRQILRPFFRRPSGSRS